jgi:glutamate racemase
VVEAVARRYAVPLRRAKVDTLILGCTHYPYLKGVLGKVMGPKVRLIDSADETAAETERVLTGLGLRAAKGRKGARAFYASDAPERFGRLGTRMLGAKIAKVGLHSFDA